MQQTAAHGRGAGSPRGETLGSVIGVTFGARHAQRGLVLACAAALRPRGVWPAKSGRKGCAARGRSRAENPLTRPVGAWKCRVNTDSSAVAHQFSRCAHVRAWLQRVAWRQRPFPAVAPAVTAPRGRGPAMHGACARESTKPRPQTAHKWRSPHGTRTSRPQYPTYCCSSAPTHTLTLST